MKAILATIVLALVACKTAGTEQQLSSTAEVSRGLAFAQIDQVGWLIDGKKGQSDCKKIPGKSPSIYQRCQRSYSLNRIATGGWQDGDGIRVSPELSVKAPVIFRRDDLDSDTAYFALGVKGGTIKDGKLNLTLDGAKASFRPDHFAGAVRLGNIFQSYTELRVYKVELPFPNNQKTAEFDMIVDGFQLQDGTSFLNTPPELTFFRVDIEQHRSVKAGRGSATSAYQYVTSLRFE